MKLPLVWLQMLKAVIDWFNHCNSRVLTEASFEGSLTENRNNNKCVPPRPIQPASSVCTRVTAWQSLCSRDSLRCCSHKKKMTETLCFCFMPLFDVMLLALLRSTWGLPLLKIKDANPFWGYCACERTGFLWRQGTIMTACMSDVYIYGLIWALWLVKWQ